MEVKVRGVRLRADARQIEQEILVNVLCEGCRGADLVVHGGVESNSFVHNLYDLK